MLNRRRVLRRSENQMFTDAFLETSRSFAIILQSVIPLCNQRSPINFPSRGWRISCQLGKTNRGWRVRCKQMEMIRESRSIVIFHRTLVIETWQSPADHVSSTARLKIKQLSGTCSKIAKNFEKTTLSPKTLNDTKNLHKFPAKCGHFPAEIPPISLTEEIKTRKFPLTLESESATWTVLMANWRKRFWIFFRFVIFNFFFHSKIFSRKTRGLLNVRRTIARAQTKRCFAVNFTLPTTAPTSPPLFRDFLGWRRARKIVTSSGSEAVSWAFDGVSWKSFGGPGSTSLSMHSLITRNHRWSINL